MPSICPRNKTALFTNCTWLKLINILPFYIILYFLEDTLQDYNSGFVQCQTQLFHIQSTQCGYYAETLTTVDMCIQQCFLASRIRVSNWYSKCHHFLGDPPVWSLVDPMEWLLFWKEDYVLDKIGTMGILCPTCMACSSQCGHQWAYSLPINWLTAFTIAMIVRQEFMMHQIRHGSWFMLMEFTVLTPPSRNNCPKRTVEWHFKGS